MAIKMIKQIESELVFMPMNYCKEKMWWVRCFVGGYGFTVVDNKNKIKFVDGPRFFFFFFFC